MTDWIKVLLEFLSANKAAVILVFVLVICLGGSFIDGFAALHQQYETWLYLAAAFAISVLIVQLIVWLKDQYFARHAQKLEEERAERAKKLEEEKAERAQKLEEQKAWRALKLEEERAEHAKKLEEERIQLAQMLEKEKARQQRRQVLERNVLYFNYLTVAERKILFDAFQKKRTTFVVDISDQSVNRLISDGYLGVLPSQDPYEIYEKTVVLNRSTIDLLNECFDELMCQYEKDRK